jgi:hypothetical protein
MLINWQHAVYNSRNPEMQTLLRRFRRALSCIALLPALFVAFASRAEATDWHTPVQQLALKIVAATGPGAVAFQLNNRSSLEKRESDEIASGLKTQLTAAGLQFVKPEQAVATVQVSLSENLQSYVWVAEIHEGSSESSVVLVSMPRLDSSIFTHQASQPTIRKVPLWSQDEPILDVVSLDVNGTPLHLIVLSPEQLGIYRFQDNRWQQDQLLPITHSRPWPRDLRGRLILSKDHLFDVYMPGVFCRSTAAAPLSLACRDSDDPWPLGSGDTTQNAFFSPTRNFFTGVLVPGVGNQKTATRFYSAAPIPREKYALWAFSGVDGQTHLLDGMTDLAANLGWGSGLASVKTGCGTAWQILASHPSDGGTDSIRAFEFPDRDPLPVSAPLEFSGKITALWTEPSGSTAIAVSQNSETGKYEAVRLAISCGQ